MRTPYTYILYFITSCTSWDSNILFKLVFNSIKFAFCNLVYFWILYNQTVLQLQKNHPTVHDLNYTFNSLVVLLACQCLMPATSSLRDQVDTAMNPPSFKFWKRLLSLGAKFKPAFAYMAVCSMGRAIALIWPQKCKNLLSTTGTCSSQCHQIIPP